MPAKTPTFEEKLKAAIAVSKGLTQDEAARQMGVSLRSLQRYLKEPIIQNKLEEIRQAELEGVKKAASDRAFSNSNQLFEELEAFASQQAKLHKVATNVSVKMFELAYKRLATLDPDEMDAKTLATVVSAAASVANSGSNAQAHNLSVYELLGELKGNGQKER